MRCNLATVLVLAAAASVGADSMLSAQEFISISDDSAVETAKDTAVDLLSGCDDASRSDCEPASCQACDGAYPPLWTVTADALILQRCDSSGAVLMFNTAEPTQNLNADDLQFPFQGGVDLTLGRQFAGDNALQVRYFGIDGWNAATTAATTAGDLLQVNAALPVLTFAGSAIHASKSSELQNVEINGVRWLSDRLTLLGGFRYAELDEHFAIGLADAPIPFRYHTRTRNRLWGGQLGADLVLWDRGGSLTVAAAGKAGIYGNAAAHDSRYSTGVFAPEARGHTASTAFIGELGVTGRCHLTEHLSVHGGYRLLWIDGVALAADQLAVSNFLAGTGIDASGDAFYHGALVGLEYAW
jgi:hypothetical protein